MRGLPSIDKGKREHFTSRPLDSKYWLVFEFRPKALMHLIRGFLPLTIANIAIKSEMLSDRDDISSVTRVYALLPAYSRNPILQNMTIIADLSSGRNSFRRKKAKMADLSSGGWRSFLLKSGVFVSVRRRRRSFLPKSGVFGRIHGREHREECS